MMVTTEELQKFCDKYVTDGEGLLETYIQSAEETVEGFLGYSLENEEVSELHVGYGDSLLALRAPVVAVSAATENGEAVELVVDHDNYVRFSDISRKFEPSKLYNVTYTKGYTSETLPASVKLAILQIASLNWETADGNLAVSSTSYADTGTRVFNNFTADRFLEKIRKLQIREW